MDSIETTSDLPTGRLSDYPSAPAVSTLLKEDGTVVMGHEGCRERLAEYFDELYNVPPLAERLAGRVRRAVVTPVPPIREDPPPYKEVERVVSKMNGC